MVQKTTVELDNDQPQESSSVERCETTQVPAHHFYQVSVVPERLKIHQFCDDINYAYSNTLLLNLPETEDSEISETTVTVISSCILFNLALCYHCLGVQGRDSAISKAVHLYRLSRQALYSDPFAYEVPAMMMIAILSLNNEASAHLDLCDASTAKSCAEQMLMVLQGSIEAVRVSLPSGLWESLEWNLLFMLFQSNANAKAA